MVADVPVGAFLSGGVDSSAIVSSMCRATDPSRIVTFCASVTKEKGRADNFGDDIVYARGMAARLGVQLVEVPTEANLIDELAKMLWDLDEPTADFAALQTRKIAAEARRHGIKVLLSGTGGDDVFTGYGRHTAAHVWTLLNRIPGGRAAAGAAIRNFPSTSLLGRRLARLGALLALDEEDMLIEAMSFSTWPPPARLALLAAETRRGLKPSDAIGNMAEILKRTRGLPPVDRMLQLDLDGFLPDLNLNYADKMAMQESVELRVPILDPRLVAFAMKVPTAQKINLWETKRIFRAAFKERLPQSILKRPKQGFGAPVRAWLAGPAQALLNEATAPRVLKERGLFDGDEVARLRRAFDTQQGDVAFTLFTIVAIELWCRGLEATPTLGPIEARAAA
jgi:asparagine synthase (glutamine-hydrolysing)